MTTEPKSTGTASRAEKAYAHYLSLGDRRTYGQVAQEIGVSVATVKRWSKAGRWTSRIRESQAQTARELADRYQAGEMEQTERNLKIVRAALINLAKDIAERKLKGQYSDIARLVHLEKDLQSPAEPKKEGARAITIFYMPDGAPGGEGCTYYTKGDLRELGLNPS